MISNKIFILNIALTFMLQIAQVHSVTKEERLSGLMIKPDGPEFDIYIPSNGFHNCNIDTDGELFTIGMIRPKDFLADVGANVGDWSLRAFAHQPAILVCCFEPIPMLHPLLKTNLMGKQVLFSELAMSDEPGNATFVYYPKEPHLSSLYRRSDESNYNINPIYIPVELERLDSFCEKHQISNINILKIDVEGGEYHVILGAQRLLEKQAIDVIQFEYATTYLDSKSSLKEVYDYLTDYGFTIYRLTPWGLIEITHWRDALESFQFSNYIALRNT